MDRRYDVLDSNNLLNDSNWALLKAALFRIRNTQGPSKRQNDREFLTAIIYLVKTGDSWRQLPKFFGEWSAVYMRFRRWESSRTWAYLWRELKQDSLIEIMALFLDSDFDAHPADDIAHKRHLSVAERLRNAVRMVVW